MKIITRGVLDWDGNVLEEESFEYCGHVAECKDSGPAPTPTDPYAQAAAQYGLATGTANYNAALNRTNSSNPLGSNTWNVTGYDGSGAGGIPGTNTGPSGAPPTMSTGTQGAPQFGGVPGGLAGQAYGFGGNFSPNISGGYNLGGAPSLPGVSSAAGMGGTGAPKYTQQTSLTPWANQLLSSPINTSNIPGVGGKLNTAGIAGLGGMNTQGIPGFSNIDTSNIPGMPGGPSLTQSLQNTQGANYNQQMAYLQPQQALQNEQSDSQLANQGITPGSAAYGQAKDQLGRQQTFANQQAADSAILAGNQEQAQLYGLGTQSLNNQLNLGNASFQNQMNYGNSSLQNQTNFGNSTLQNQLALRNAPISEYEALQGNPTSQVNAQTPDISGAFGQQYQGQLAGYNANVASNNADTSAVVGAGSSALMAYAILGAAF